MQHDEEVLYDRQVRLWGVEAQAQIRKSKVLVRGEFLGLSCEICKNLALAGVNLTLVEDSALVGEADLATNVFFRASDVNAVGRTGSEVLDRIREMTFAEVSSIPGGAASVAEYKIVVSVNESFEVMKRLSDECRQAGVPLVCCREAGLLGFCLLDFGKEFAFKRDDDSAAPSTAKFPTLTELLEFTRFDLLNKKTGFGFFAVLLAAQQGSGSKRQRLDEARETGELDKAIELFAQPPSSPRAGSSSSAAPVCTILGGLVGNEVLKAVSGKGEPSNNFIFFDAKDCGAAVRQIPPSA